MDKNIKTIFDYTPFQAHPILVKYIMFLSSENIIKKS